MPRTAGTPVIPAREIVLEGEDPVTVIATVASVERRDEPGRGGRVVGLEAMLHLQIPGARSYHSLSLLSRLVDEPYWLTDARFGPNGELQFAHGFGSRCVRKSGVTAPLEALLDDAVRAHGLAAAIGPNIPLALTT